MAGSFSNNTLAEVFLVKDEDGYTLKTKWVKEIYSKFTQCANKNFEKCLLLNAKWNKNCGAEFIIVSKTDKIILSSCGGVVGLTVNGEEKISFKEKDENSISFMIDGMALSLILNEEKQYSTFVFANDYNYSVVKNGKVEEFKLFEPK